MKYIDPLRDLGGALLGVEKPNRYVGGEYGCLARPGAFLQTVIGFPDLYEIGMSNQAVRILYNRLNRLEDVSCDRVFAPAPDFEALLKDRGIPLYGLETGLPLGAADLFLVTLGYELGITGVLTILEAGGIPLRRADRGEGDPLVIMGGPGVSNPLPYSRFIDIFWIGEAEAGFFDLIRRVARMKREGLGRAAWFAEMAGEASVWFAGKSSASRAVDGAFGKGPPDPAVFPVPSLKVLQHHGAVEIMRGCPNGCRFCHAGYWYRPMRQKPADRVLAEAEAFIRQGGYREISLSSLSTGDYRGLEELTEALNARYRGRHISFQLPSLRVSTFSLSLLAKVGAVRKSGLTFAVETPIESWQGALNKEVSRDTVVAILQSAKKQGWKSAKFYFMVGLPVPKEETALEEEAEIVNFITYIARRTGMRFHITVGLFVPKAHTPYQGAVQLEEPAARRKIGYIRSELKPLGHKVGIQDPFMSVLEGLLSRGDARVGELIEEAFALGCRLDPWTEYLRPDLWRSLLEKREPLVQDILQGRVLSFAKIIDSGPSAEYLKEEGEKSQRQELTGPCRSECGHPCGVCGSAEKKVIENLSFLAPSLPEPPLPLEKDTYRLLFRFCKAGPAVFQPHLAVLEIFAGAFLRADLPVLYSRGFNPLPRLELASPLRVGISAEGEMASADFGDFIAGERFMEALNPCLPSGFRVEEGRTFRIPEGVKKHSLASLLWGYSYKTGSSAPPETVPAAEEKAYRIAKTGGSGYGLIRSETLAKSREDPTQPASYFRVYQDLYPF